MEGGKGFVRLGRSAGYIVKDEGERGEGPSAMGRQVRVCVCVTDMVCCKGDSR